MLAMFSLFNAGCAWMGFGDDESSVTQTEEANAATPTEPAVQIEQAAPESSAPKKATKTTSKAKKGAKSEAEVKAALDQKANQLVAQSARTLLPNKAHKEVKKVGSEWVATYMNVDTHNVSTELRPGANGQYTGLIRYKEEIMQCRGATREAALAAPCERAGARRLTELIRYDGREWQD